MKTSQFNSIAARIAIAIALAILLGVVLEVGLAAGFDYFLSRADPGPNGLGIRIVASRSAILAVDPRRNAPMLSSKIATVVRVLASAPEAERSSIIEAVSEPTMQIALRAEPPAEGAGREDDRLGVLRQLIQLQLEQLQPSPRVIAHRLPDHGDLPADGVGLKATQGTAAVVEVALPDGRWLAITIADYPSEGFKWPALMLSLGLLLVVVGLVSAWTARRLAAPIRDFASAAERLGVDMIASPLAVRGPYELRTAIGAFNLMQERLRRFLEDRTQMLAAISHDLRAPLARMRLRAEFVEDEEQQRKMFGDLAAMNAMIDSTLAFARDAARQEPRTLVDLSVLVEDVCEDVADAGGAVRYLGPRGTEVRCRPAVVRRAIGNLVDNAVKYGHSVQVDVVRESGRVVIVVDDDGPGIAPEEQEKVFAPFYRLGPARDPDKGGVGLGLSVARTIAREHGGDVTLTNREGGGLSVRLELPIDAS